jgi:SprT-like protein
MNNKQLTVWIRDISMRYFGIPFQHEAYFNARLKTTGGRYFPRTHHIDINPKHLDHFGHEEVEGIIKHELCHYHLHLAGKGYRHQDQDFKLLLQKVGGSRFCQAPPDQRKSEPYRYEVGCTGCQVTFMRKRKFNVRKYVCRQCGGKFRVRELQAASRK